MSHCQQKLHTYRWRHGESIERIALRNCAARGLGEAFGRRSGWERTGVCQIAPVFDFAVRSPKGSNSPCKPRQDRNPSPVDYQAVFIVVSSGDKRIGSHAQPSSFHKPTSFPELGTGLISASSHKHTCTSFRLSLLTSQPQWRKSNAGIHSISSGRRVSCHVHHLL